ncbi:MAG: hypothetical protein ABI680_02465 [Chthoniobacteraceae bacterium]
MKATLVVAVLAPFTVALASVDDAVKSITEVQREGSGNAGAASAWDDVVRAGPSALTVVLAASGQGNIVADNWLRVAAGAIVENSLSAHKPLPLDELEAFVRDTKHAGPARQLAFDLIAKADVKRATKIESSLANDPVQELRRGAVQRLIESAKAKQGEAAKTAYLEALEAVRDEDQTRVIVAALKEFDVPVDLPAHFGFLMDWQVIGPFDNAGRLGFDTVFPPETEIDLQATYPGKTEPVKWQEFVSHDDYGKIDLNQPLGMLKEATAYAVTTINAPEDRDAELRLGCKNAWKIWLNGELLFSRDEYHRLQQMDQFKLKCRLKKGVNTVLVKCCQNEQKEEWTVEWEFQLRLCDSTGTAIPSRNSTASQ